MTTWPVWHAMRPIEVTRLASAPRLHLVVRLVLADRAHQVIPLELVRVRLVLGPNAQTRSSLLTIFWPL